MGPSVSRRTAGRLRGHRAGPGSLRRPREVQRRRACRAAVARAPPLKPRARVRTVVSKRGEIVKEKLVQEAAPRTWVLVFDADEDPVPELERFAERQRLRGAHLTAIGAFSEAVVAYFAWDAKQYRPIPFREQVEVLSLVGDIAEAEGKPKLHAHVVLGRGDGSAVGGHLRSARVRPTLEVVLQETPAHLVRVHDPATGLALIDPRRGER